MYFFLEKRDNSFLELERRNGLSAVPTYNCQNVPERSCANDDVICVITSTIKDNYIPIEQLTFQSAAAHLPASLGTIELFHVCILLATPALAEQTQSAEQSL